MRNFGGAAACAAAVMALSAAAPVLAQTSPTEGDLLAAQFAHAIFAAVDLKSQLAKEMESAGAGFATDGRPEWKALLIEAAREELDHDLPALELIMGRDLSSQLSIGELKAGVAFLNSPGVPEWFVAVIKDENAPPPAPVRKALAELGKTADGRGFADKLGKLNTNPSKSVEQDFVAELVPGMLRRFGEKAEAAEAARAAAR